MGGSQREVVKGLSRICEFVDFRGPWGYAFPMVFFGGRVGLSALVLIGCSAFSCARGASQPLSREEAWKRVKSELAISEASPFKVYAAKVEMPGGAKIAIWGGTVTVPDELSQAWFFFVDKAPEANWEHACAYVFVDGSGGQVIVLEAKRPPDRLDQLEMIFPEKT